MCAYVYTPENRQKMGNQGENNDIKKITPLLGLASVIQLANSGPPPLFKAPLQSAHESLCMFGAQGSFALCLLIGLIYVFVSLSFPEVKRSRPEEIQLFVIVWGHVCTFASHGNYSDLKRVYNCIQQCNGKSTCMEVGSFPGNPIDFLCIKLQQKCRDSRPHLNETLIEMQICHFKNFKDCCESTAWKKRSEKQEGLRNKNPQLSNLYHDTAGSRWQLARSLTLYSLATTSWTHGGLFRNFRRPHVTGLSVTGLLREMQKLTALCTG